MVQRVHRVDVGAAGAPERTQPLDRVRVGAFRRGEDAPAVLEQVGEARIGSRLFCTGERGAGNEVDVGRHMRLHLRDHRRLGRADIGDNRASLQCRRDAFGNRAGRADGHRDDDEVGILHRLRRIGDVAVAQLQFFRAGKRCGASGRDHQLAGQPFPPDDAGERRADQADADKRDPVEHLFGHRVSLSRILRGRRQRRDWLLRCRWSCAAHWGTRRRRRGAADSRELRGTRPPPLPNGVRHPGSA